MEQSRLPLISLGTVGTAMPLFLESHSYCIVSLMNLCTDSSMGISNHMYIITYFVIDVQNTLYILHYSNTFVIAIVIFV